MAFYLVRAEPEKKRMDELKKQLQNEDFKPLRPFGKTLHNSLLNARMDADGNAVWEEEDYCTPPLAQEREAALDYYFNNLSIAEVERGEGWKQIQSLPRLFPELADKNSK